MAMWTENTNQGKMTAYLHYKDRTWFQQTAETS